MEALRLLPDAGPPPLRLPLDPAGCGPDQYGRAGTAAGGRPRPPGPVQELYDEPVVGPWVRRPAMAEEQLRSRAGPAATVRGGGALRPRKPDTERPRRALGGLGLLGDCRRVVVVMSQRRTVKRASWNATDRASLPGEQ